MQGTRYAVGLDVGTGTVRAVVACGEDGAPATIVGVGEQPNFGMRKGTIVNLDKTAEAVDRALEAAERMSGYHIDNATVSINGSHIVGLSSQGVIAVGASGHEIGADDLRRVEEAATVVRLPANREILDVTPRSYTLDSQDNIKDPFGMTGVRLEVDAYMITALAPHVKNLDKVLEMTELPARNIIVSGVAAAKAVLTDQQRENGVVLIDIGASTTNVAVFEEGDLIHLAILPVGGNNVTNDLAIGLKTDLDVAEKVKLEHSYAASGQREKDSMVKVKIGGAVLEFDTHLIDDIVEARLGEIFDLVNGELKKCKRLAKLPGGAVLTGGGAKLRGITDLARDNLQLAARVAQPAKFGGMGDKVASPEWSAAIGLMLIDLETAAPVAGGKKPHGAGGGLAKKLSGLFKKKK
ncbi:MAG: cell division protein FtsA [Candidatus Nomurabacteria bacterium]|jgi:cell division protein FtsA|nr:cell division protein FtsA [Candidatus Nomurabacteria bacterium]